MSNNTLKVTVKIGAQTKDFDLAYTVEKSDNLTEVYSFTVEGEAWKAFEELAYIQNKGKFNIVGFRKGHAPKSVIENTYGKDVFVSDTEEVAVNEVYNALMESKTVDYAKLAMRPALDVSALENGKVSFTLTVAYMPSDVEIKYTGLEIQKVLPDVDGAVEREVAAARDRAGFWEVVDREVKNGDQINLDYSGSIDGVKFDGGTAEKQDLVIGSGAFIPGFEDQLVGAKAGEERDVKVTFPEDYGAKDLAGKEAVFACKVNTVKEKKLPELDDDFAKDVSEFDTLDAYKADIRKKAEERETKNAEIATSNRIVEALIKNNSIELSAALIDQRAQNMLADMRHNMESQGIPFATYLKYIGKTEQDLIDGYKAEAKDRETTRFIMNHIVEKENIQVTQADFEAAIEVRAASAGKKTGDYRRNMKQDEADYILNTLMTDKIIKFLSEHNDLKE